MTTDNTDDVTITMDRLRWAEVLLALAKAEKNDEASETAQERWGEALEIIKDEATITMLDLSELQEMYRRKEEA